MQRKYFIDWIRVIAIGLLLIYHVAIGFQSWGVMIGFIAKKESWNALWIPMTMLNVWRIPLLFFVSGMGVYFAMQHRDWKQLIGERALRIFVPFLFGMFVLVPIHIAIWRYYYGMKLVYVWDPGHLWFLGNIMAYVVMLFPLLYFLKRNENGTVGNRIRKIFSSPVGLFIVAAAFVIEVLIIKPVPFELYAKTIHGFVIGLLAFLFGFCFVLTGDGFWNMIQRWRWVLLTLAVCLFIPRVLQFGMNGLGWPLAIESVCWISTVLAFGSKYLNRPGPALTYLSEAAYPVYILHMIFLNLGALLIFPLDIPVPLQFVLNLLFTIAGCFIVFEFVRRVRVLRGLFGMKMKK